MSLNRHFTIRLLPALTALLVCACGFAQVQAPTASNPYPMPPMSVVNPPPPTSKPAAQPTPHPTTAASPARPSPSVPATPKPNAIPARPAPFSLLNVPAEPARVSLASGKLTIEANNSSLSDILGQIAKAGGMKISGLHPNAGQRVFGKYGPGAPREVLSDLLNGSGFNVVMLGVTPTGTPRELSLSARAGGPSRPSARPSEADQDIENEPPPEDVESPQEDDQTPDQNPDQPFDREEPSMDQAQPEAAPNAPKHIRTPQEILQQLRRMHQQQPPQ